jgi:hypothetical protein
MWKIWEDQQIFRPAQFSFLPQPDFRTAGEPSEHGDAESDKGVSIH